LTRQASEGAAESTIDARLMPGSPGRPRTRRFDRIRTVYARTGALSGDRMPLTWLRSCLATRQDLTVSTGAVCGRCPRDGFARARAAARRWRSWADFVKDVLLARLQIVW